MKNLSIYIKEKTMELFNINNILFNLMDLLYKI